MQNGMPDEQSWVRDYEGDEILSPSFRIGQREEAGIECVDLFMQTFSQKAGSSNLWESAEPGAWHLLATIYAGMIVMRPVHAFPHALHYLSSRHGIFHTVVYRDDDSPPALPATANEAVDHIEARLPRRLFYPCSYGLGLVKHLERFWIELSSARAHILTIVRRDVVARMAGGVVEVSERDVLAVLRKFDRIKRVASGKVRDAKRWVVRNDLLPQLDPERFPRMVAVQGSPGLVELRREGRQPSAAVARAGRRETVQAVRGNLPVLAAEEPRELMRLHAEIERVTLEQMIARYEQMLQQSLPEARWQRFFEENVFILALLFARPVRLLHSQFHAQPPALSGSGAQIGDFLMAQEGQAMAIVEIKKPATEMTSPRPYRNTEVFGPSAEISGAVTQVLFQQSALRINWLMHASRDVSLSQSRPDAIRCVVIAGMAETDAARSRSLEIFRNACKDVEVITFDELLGKLRLLHSHLAPPAAENDAPF